MLQRLVHFAARGRKRPWRLLQIEPSLECNLECVMCPWPAMRPGNGLMARETFANLAPYLHMAKGVDLTGGGEPATNEHLAGMVAAASAAGCEVGFSTNGLLLDRRLAGSLLDRGLDWLAVSVDAATPETYARIRQGGDFELLDANLRSLASVGQGRRRPLRLMLVFVLMRDNFAELPAYVDLAARWGAGHVIVKNLDVIVKEGDDERRIFEGSPELEQAVEAVLSEAQRKAAARKIVLRRYRSQPAEQVLCEPDPLQSLFVSWAGDVAPCITLAYASSRVFEGRRRQEPCLHFGNVRRQALPQIWQDPAYRAFRAAYTARLNWQSQAALTAALNGETASLGPIPSAPGPCRTCYYLYGV